MKQAALILLLLISSILNAQQMEKRPLIVFGQFNSIKPESSESGELDYGSIVNAMLQTAVHENFVFSVSGVSNASLSEAARQFNSSPRSVYLIEGTAYRLNNMIQADIRIYDVKKNALVHSDFFSVANQEFLRMNVTQLVHDLANRLFRDILGGIEIHTTTENADVFLDSIFCGTTDSSGRLELLQIYPGTYQLRILATGYTEYNETLTIQPRSKNQVQASIRMEPGSLMVQSTPESASVFLDGQLIGTTPIQLNGIEVGEHSLKLQLPGFKGWDERISIRSRQQLGINAELEVQPGVLRVTSVPEGASVFISGTEIGTTPITTYELPAGKYGLEIRKDGHHPIVLSAEIEAGNFSEYEKELVPMTGFLDIESNIAGAMVKIKKDGKVILTDQIPVRNLELPFGRYYIEISEDGYQTVLNKTVTISNESRQSVSYTLLPKPGNIWIESNPSGGIVYLNDVRQGVTPLVISDLEPGSYNLRVETSVTSYEKIVQVEADQTHMEEIDLEKNENYLLPAVILSALAAASFFISGVQ